MQTKETKEKNRVFFAFPGMGKTTYALSKAGAVDLDFGNFRSAFGRGRKSGNTADLLIPFSKLIKYYWQDGYNVLTNEPSLIPLVKQFAEGYITMVLPKDDELHVERVKQRALGNNRHDLQFAREMERHYDEWINGWMEKASNYKLPIKFVHYFEEVM